MDPWRLPTLRVAGSSQSMNLSIKHFTSSLYTGRLFARAVLEVCLLVVLVEGIYLSERSISILKMIIDEPIGLANFVPLLAWTAPEVYLALPIAVLIAVYRVILRSRERLEFIALASGGQSTVPLIRSTTLVALLALLASLAISGVVYPYSQYALRRDVDTIHYQALRAGSSPGQFLFFPNYAIYVFPSTADQANRPIFIKQIVDNDTYRIVNADRTELVAEPQPGWMTIRMIGVTVNNFPNADEAWTASEQEKNADTRDLFCNDCGDRIKSLRTVSLLRNLDIKDLVHFEPRGVSLDEWTAPELLGLTNAPAGRDRPPGAAVEADRRLARGLLCFLAPFLAWLSLALTTRTSQAFVLPAGCISLMCGDIAFSQVISRFGPNAAGLVAAALLAITVAIAGVLLRQIVTRQHLAVFPALARS
jgi:lipopolysaccharide export system permease protein